MSAVARGATILWVDESSGGPREPQALRFLADHGFAVEGVALAEMAELVERMRDRLAGGPTLLVFDGDPHLIVRLNLSLPVLVLLPAPWEDPLFEDQHHDELAFLHRPFTPRQLLAAVERAIRFAELKKENLFLRRVSDEHHAFHNIIGKSKAMRAVFDLVERVAQASANVLITGESGTGKELIARAIHERGPRAKGPFIAINCTSLPENLLESELFGHAKGAFTGAITEKRGLFEEAHHGTIFLDEIGDMDITLQAKLLRAIQEKRIRPVGANEDREIDVRIVAATHKDLRRLMREGHFREDLYYRLSVIPIALPPLRLRREDIPLLVEFFLQKYVRQNSSRVRGFLPSAMELLVRARWEGNVRELENLVERVVVLAQQEWVTPEDLAQMDLESAETILAQATADWPTLEDLERRYIHLVLEKTGHRKERAAQILGINRRTLLRKESESP